jgi:hypothetical protein
MHVGLSMTQLKFTESCMREIRFGQRLRRLVEKRPAS